MNIRGSLHELVAWDEQRNSALDGLRGLAILLVLASHASAGRFPLGGMVGVTLFFVLSGYLITGVLLRERERSGGVDFVRFYVRRGVRLLPALAALLILAPVALWLMRDPRLGPDLIGASLAAFFYLSDFLRASGDPLVVLGHTWSLAVEEQFYLIWPVLLVLVASRWLTRRRLLPSVIVLGAAFAVWRLAASGVFSFDRAYFALDTNAFGLLFGACLALRPAHLSSRAGTILATSAAAALLVFAMVPLEPGSAAYYVALTFGAPVAGLLAVAAVAGAQTAQRPFTMAPLVFFGRISYSLYLWHEVILLSKPGGSDIDGAWRAVAVAAALLLALLSWVFVESPAQNIRKRLEARGRAAAGAPLSVG